MLERADKPSLTIDKYPPEKAIYRSLFDVGGLHRKTKDGWQFRAPTKTDPLNLKPLWREIDQFFVESEDAPLVIT